MKDSSNLLFDLVLFGGTGDLAMRKLLPALYQLYRTTPFHSQTRIIAVGRTATSKEAFLHRVQDKLEQHLPADSWDRVSWQQFSKHLNCIAIEADKTESYRELIPLLDDDDRPRTFYFSTHSSLYTAIASSLGALGLINANARVVLEKPIGRDLGTAKTISGQMSNYFTESQIYRIDHYLGKETVQNLLVLRFANPLFESLWNHHYIDHIQITISEAIGVEGRGEFYEETGALRDIVQNHLLQLLCMLAMEPPANIEPDRIRDEKLKVLYALQPLLGDDISRYVVRGQYAPGTIAGKPCTGYTEEEGVAENSTIETFVAMKVMIDNMRWSGVPFYLRTGKRLPNRSCEIVVQFKEVPHWIFDTPRGQLMSNQLVITLQPDESITLRLCGKRLGPGIDVRTIDLNLNPKSRGNKRSADAYERLLLDVIKGDQTLFLRQDELEQAWHWVDPILETWERTTSPPEHYASGSWGPAGSTLLLAKDGRLWFEGANGQGN
ncbi:MULTISPECIES: glucose-6-phosphate dehydrogenase [unclassified Ketobacter]|uniref:glucose-6-phosphate dehydrogenase n=1 Tax=unclassified Ketobacter TaxID=2639109 RepID=UPI0025C358DD|nr:MULTISPECIES: glucose-6-phosphate dehydrogenase [unclassified Ketobacter]MCK5792757.1 glucose-6-phosphate dehydrogenase [Ketobacter sp.]